MTHWVIRLVIPQNKSGSDRMVNVYCCYKSLAHVSPFGSINNMLFSSALKTKFQLLGRAIRRNCCVLASKVTSGVKAKSLKIVEGRSHV